MVQVNLDMAGVSEEDVERQKRDGGGGGYLLEEGWHEGVVVESDFRRTKAGNGELIEVRIETLGGQQMRDWFVIAHPNPKVVTIALAKLRALCEAVQHPQPDQLGDTDELHGVPFFFRVYHEADDQGKEQNRIGGFRSTKEHEGHAPAKEEAPKPTRRRAPARPASEARGDFKLKRPSEDDIPF